jgi:sugar phosphate isomerase/epimerase
MSLSYQQQFNTGKMDMFSFIERAYQLRLDGMDIHMGALASRELEYLRAVRMGCLRRGLMISYLGVSNNFGVPGEELPAQMAMVREGIDVAAFMGVPLVRVFAAWVREGADEEHVWTQTIGCFQEIAAYGEEKGVMIGLHNHNHGCVTRTGKDVRRILETVNHPYFTHILDTGQYVGSPGASGSGGRMDDVEQLYASIEETAPLAVHVRAKIYRIQTGEEAWLDYPRIFDTLNRVGYNGWVSIVYEGQSVEPEETAVPKAVSYLRRFVPGPLP